MLQTLLLLYFQEAINMSFAKGEKLKTAGLDMSCNEVVVEAEFVRYLDKDVDTDFDCVIISDGVSQLAFSSELEVA